MQSVHAWFHKYWQRLIDLGTAFHQHSNIRLNQIKAVQLESKISKIPNNRYTVRLHSVETMRYQNTQKKENRLDQNVIHLVNDTYG